MESEKLKIYQNRLLVAELIKDVLIDKITVQRAIELFPKEKNDISIKCAFDALMHREADEDIRNKDIEFRELQDEYLSDIAQILKEGNDLPSNIVDEYLKYHSDNLIGEWDKSAKTIIKFLKRMINF